jgi:hypothetical protein
VVYVVNLKMIQGRKMIIAAKNARSLGTAEKEGS